SRRRRRALGLFYQLPQAKKWGHAAAFDTSLGSALVGAGYGIARKLRRHGYESLLRRWGSLRAISHTVAAVVRAGHDVRLLVRRRELPRQRMRTQHSGII